MSHPHQGGSSGTEQGYLSSIEAALLGVLGQGVPGLLVVVVFFVGTGHQGTDLVATASETGCGAVRYHKHNTAM